MPSRRVWILALVLSGAAVTVAGIWVARSATAHQFGWFAYAPLIDDVQVPRVVTGRAWLGWAVASSGLIVLSGLVGYLLGSRRSAPHPG